MMKASRSRVLVHGVILLAAAAAGCARTELGAPGPDFHPVQAPASFRVNLDGLVSADYRDGKALTAWNATAIVIERALAAWYPSLTVRPHLADPSPEEVSRGLTNLPGPDAADLSIVYLASRQSSAGEWEFTRGGGLVSWGRLLGSSQAPVNPRRLVILDACYAAATLRFPEWRSRLAPLCLLAGTADELTYDLDFYSRRPVDFVRRFPRAAAWLKANMPPGWNGKMSFLGFIWLQAYLRTERAPTTAAAWAAFFRTCDEESGAFRARHSAGISSTVHGYVPDGRAGVESP